MLISERMQTMPNSVYRELYVMRGETPLRMLILDV